MSRVIGFEDLVSGRSFRVYPDRRWINPIADGTPENPGGQLDLSWRRKDGGYLDLDCRIWFFTDITRSAGMISQIPGKGAKYMIGFTDSEGTPLSGGTSHRISLVPNIPAANFWSVTLYEAENASGGKQYGTQPGFYLLIGPNWKGDVPAGINAVFRSSTDLCAIFPRVFQDDTPEDKVAIQSVLNQIMVYPLSERV